MRIGILTFHKAYNYGAFLQCYSLARKLERGFPNDTIEVINYESKNMQTFYKTDIISLMFGRSTANKPLNFRMHLSKLKQFSMKLKCDSNFVKHLRDRNECFERVQSCLPLSAKSLISDEEEEVWRFIDELSYDVVVVGSDAIWNDLQTNTPNIYYLNKSIRARKMSYAASSFGFDYKKRGESFAHEVGQRMNAFDFIGVRDTATENYVYWTNSKITPVHTCDPSIVIDFSDPLFDQKEYLDKLLIENGIDLNKPIYGIMGSDWLGKIARRLIGEDAQLVAVYAPNIYANCYLSSLTPFQWAKIFGYFTVTFTHFFHGTLFSLLNGTPTMTIEWEDDYAKKYDTKMVDVLKRLQLLNYYYTKDTGENNIEVLKEHFDYVVGHIQEEKVRISAGLKQEAETYSQFEAAINQIKE